MRSGTMHMNGLALRHCCNLAMWNRVVAALAAGGYYGKPFIIGMSSVYSRDMLTRDRISADA